MKAEQAYMTVCLIAPPGRKAGRRHFGKTVMTEILMPKATAVWLVDNTSLTFDQIADFCGLHPLEVKGIADGEVARDIRGADPIANAVMHESVHAGRPLDAFVVRKEPKDHGRGRQIEGADVTGKRVVVVEDTSTTGQSALKAVEALRREGAEVVAVAVIVDRKTGAQAAIEAEGLQWLGSIDLDDLGLAPQ